MARRIEDYGFISNMLTAALVSGTGSIDWLCLPRFDRDACFAALLGTPDNGHWQIAPAVEGWRMRRRYRPGTAILETTFETESGAATLIDFLPIGDPADRIHVVRIVRGDRGSVPMRLRALFRLGYGQVLPWVQRTAFGLTAIAGPDALSLHAPVPLDNRNMGTIADFDAREGDSLSFVLGWHPSHVPAEESFDAEKALGATEKWWREWSARTNHADGGDDNPYREPVMRSLITLKGLTFRPTGGIVAAATTSLPEEIGGVRNWDYRYCWIRDAAMTMTALLASGHREEAQAWRDWMLRAAAGHPAQLQIMYGLAGERRLREWEVPWLAGYENSRPVRVGNAAYQQLQIDIYGELMDALHTTSQYAEAPSADSWNLQKVLLADLEMKWRMPDRGIWEIRAPDRHFTHSRLLAWVAYDRAVKAVETMRMEGPADRWRAIRDEIRDDILANAWSEKRKSFVQSYGSDLLDASVLQMPIVGFLPADDPRIVSTVETIRRELTEDGLVRRYDPDKGVDGVGGDEGAFLVCSFWLADVLAMMGRRDEAEELFACLLGLRNDLGLLAEQYDPRAQRQMGNFPQALSHIGIVNTAYIIAAASGNE